MPKPKITIAEIRAKYGKMSQEAFGKSIGVSAQTVSAWEKDIFKISPKYLARICNQYNVTASDLLGV